MKKLIIIALFGIIASLGVCNAQTKTTARPVAPKVASVESDSVLMEYLDGFRRQLRESRYKLYPTENNWIFLKLDTQEGKVYMVQYAVDGGDRLQVALDTEKRVPDWVIPESGRFELYPTRNMYNFIMLDNKNGRCWQVQWSIDRDKRMIVPIF